MRADLNVLLQIVHCKREQTLGIIYVGSVRIGAKSNLPDTDFHRHAWLRDRPDCYASGTFSHKHRTQMVAHRYAFYEEIQWNLFYYFHLLE